MPIGRGDGCRTNAAPGLSASPIIVFSENRIMQIVQLSSFALANYIDVSEIFVTVLKTVEIFCKKIYNIIVFCNVTAPKGRNEVIMIKLIATDLDGTMLDDSKRLPENFDDVLKDLGSRNIRFAVSSGRSFCTLKEQFDSYLNDLIFICDNGAYVYDKGEVVSMSVLPDDAVRSIIRFCEELGLTVLLCGKKGTWHNTDKPSQVEEISSYYINQQRLEDLSSFDDEIFKVAIMEEDGIEHSAYPKLRARYGEYFNVQLSGVRWVDIMNRGVTKGYALNKMQNRLGIDYGETMSFGDYLNDIEMLENSYYSFSVDNAHPLVKKAANFSTGSNNDNSVMKEIIKLCF